MTSIRTMLIRTMLTIVGILAMMLMVLLTAPDSAFALPRERDPSMVRQACEQLKSSIEEGEQKKKDGTITSHETGELNSDKELYDHLGCDIILAVSRDVGQKDVGDKDSDVGVAPEDDGCTWKNLWCTLAPVFEAVQTIASPVLGPTNPPPNPYLLWTLGPNRLIPCLPRLCLLASCRKKAAAIRTAPGPRK